MCLTIIKLFEIIFGSDPAQTKVGSLYTFWRHGCSRGTRPCLECAADTGGTKVRDHPKVVGTCASAAMVGISYRDIYIYDILNRRSNEPERHRAITETKTARPSRTLKLKDKSLTKQSTGQKPTAAHGEGNHPQQRRTNRRPNKD